MSANSRQANTPLTPAGLEGRPEGLRRRSSFIKDLRDGKITKAVASIYTNGASKEVPARKGLRRTSQFWTKLKGNSPPQPREEGLETDAPALERRSLGSSPSLSGPGCSPVANTLEMEDTSVARLPTEVLHEIFSFVTTVPSGQFRTPDADSARWILGHVCARWRAAAISHARMWSTINIHNSPPPIDLLDRQLQLSRDLPLNIVFYQSKREHCIKLFDALILCSCRWRHLSLTLLRVQASPLLTALERVRGRLPILRTLTLEGVATTTGNPFAFELAPQLQDVTVYFQPIPIIPWQQLTRLSLTGALASLLSILRLAQNVTDLSVRLMNDGAYDANPSSLITQRIHLPAVSRCLLFQKRIMDILVLPQLETFVVEPHTALPFLALLHRSSCSLTKLGLYGDCSTAAATCLLQACPALVELTVCALSCSDTSYMDRLITHLSVTDGCTLVVPQVKRICMMAEAIDQRRFVDMVESRWRVPGHRLERVTVLLNDEWDETSARRLSALRDEGLRVRMDRTRGWGPTKQ
ncbi:hypothetical protein DFH09DRAFT_1308821 [Mycena vulgaris]|nr:hypothetical protein DFH09DRAFT_1308821 [Mycena vulgaris]